MLGETRRKVRGWGGGGSAGVKGEGEETHCYSELSHWKRPKVFVDLGNALSEKASALRIVRS
jgi:hypothetical protein